MKSFELIYFVFIYLVLSSPGSAADLKALSKWNGIIRIGSEVEINQREAIPLVSEFSLEDLDSSMISEEAVKDYLLSEINWLDLKSREPELAAELAEGLNLERKILSPESYENAKLSRSDSLVFPDLEGIAKTFSANQSNDHSILDSTGKSIEHKLDTPAATDWWTLNDRWRSLPLERKQKLVNFSLLPKKYLSEYLFLILSESSELSFEESSVFFAKKEASPDIGDILEIKDIEPFDNLKVFFRDIRYLAKRIGKTSVLNQPLNPEFRALANSFSFHYHLSIDWGLLEDKGWKVQTLNSLLEKMRLYITLKREAAGLSGLWESGDLCQAVCFGKGESNRFEFREHYDSPEIEIEYFLKLISLGPKQGIQKLMLETSSLMNSFTRDSLGFAHGNVIIKALEAGLEKESPEVLKEWIFRLLLQSNTSYPSLETVHFKKSKAEIFKALNSNPNLSKFKNWSVLKSQGDMPIPLERDRGFLELEVYRNQILNYLLTQNKNNPDKLWKEINKLENFVELDESIKKVLDVFVTKEQGKDYEKVLRTEILEGNLFAYYLLEKSNVSEQVRFELYKKGVLANHATAIQIVRQNNYWRNLDLSVEQILNTFKEGGFHLWPKVVDIFENNRNQVIQLIYSFLEESATDYNDFLERIVYEMDLNDREKENFAKKLFDAPNVNLAMQLFKVFYGARPNFYLMYLRKYLFKDSPLRDQILLSFPYHGLVGDLEEKKALTQVRTGDFSLLPSLIFSSGMGLDYWTKDIVKGLGAGDQVLLDYLLTFSNIPGELRSALVEAVLANRFKKSVKYINLFLDLDWVQEGAAINFIKERVRNHDEDAIKMLLMEMDGNRGIFYLLMAEIPHSSELRRILKGILEHKIFPQLAPEIRKEMRRYEKSLVSCRQSAS